MDMFNAPPLPVWPVNQWDIPILNVDLQPKTPSLPILSFGTLKQGVRIHSSIHFYTDDFRFNTLWDNPFTIVESDPSSVFEVNYSTRPDSARAEVLYFIYRKRWLARFWQDYDIPPFVDLNIEEAFFDLALQGVPPGWRAYANRGSSKDTNHLFRAYDLALRHSGESSIIYVVYGGGNIVKSLCSDQNWTWIPEQADAARRLARDRIHG